MRRLAYTVHVPVFVARGGVQHQDRVEVFLRGTELPEWAVPLVGDHVYEPGEAPEAVASPDPEPDSDPDPEPNPETEPEPEEKPEPPAGNASAPAWREYAVQLGADPEEVADMSRDELRDQYGK